MSLYDLAACRDTDTGLFFVEPGHNAAEAKQVCAGCPCRRECLLLALETGTDYGVFGGLTPKERAGMRRPLHERVAQCGTDAGYQRHVRIPEPACRACLTAHTSAESDRLARRVVA